MTSSEIVTAEFQLGFQLKEVARKSLDDLPVYLQAAEHFKKAGELSLEEASNPELSLTTRLQAETYGHYYLAEQMSCLAAFHFEQRQAALAAKEHQEAIEHLISVNRSRGVSGFKSSSRNCDQAEEEQF